jgi:hypothetical protein
MYKRTKNDPRITQSRKAPFSSLRAFAKNLGPGRRKNPWKVNLTKKAFPWHKLAVPVLVFFLPLFVLLAADNLVFRLPDMYNYHMLDTEILNEKMISAGEEDVARMISGYMTHRTDEFQMKEDLEYLPDNLFTEADGAMAARMRQALDIKGLLAAAAMALSVACGAVLWKLKERDWILRAFYYSLPVFLVFGIINGAGLLLGGLRSGIYGILPAVEGGADLLPAILDKGFFGLSVLAGGGISLVFLGLVYYAVFMISGRKVTFRR